MDHIEEIQNLIKNTDIKIKDTIPTKDIDILISSLEEYKPIPIKFYKKSLIEIKNTKNKCNLCKRIGQYMCDNNIYCWIHSHTLT